MCSECQSRLAGVPSGHWDGSLLTVRLLAGGALLHAGGTALPPGINIKGVKAFTFAELSRATNDFHAERELGQGGYGKVYKGELADGVVVAIKRAQEGSVQGATQFYTEIELLSRVHHRNLLELLGFCNDREEQVRLF